MISKYVDNKELKKLIEDGNLKPYKVKKVLQKQGILLPSTNCEHIASQVYPILWGSVDIEELSQSLDDPNNYIKSSLIEVSVKNSDNPLDELETFFNNASYGNTRYTLSSMIRSEDGRILLQLKYPLSKPGRMELISTQTRNINVIISKKSENRAVIDVRQATSSEMKEINKFLEDATKKDQSVTTTHISLNKLTTENKVAFFDEFNKMKFPGWRFLTVTKVELKRSQASADETKEIDEDNESDSIANLQGITSAILNGTSIRNNSFVQECLDNNFFVSVMGYKFENMSDLVEVVVEINFKYDDLKIDICKTYEYDNDAEDLRLHPLIMSIQEGILQMFQNAAYQKYNEILKKQLKELTNKK
jgi:hypothetical protein